jgi:hypothetical protein
VLPARCPTMPADPRLSSRSHAQLAAAPVPPPSVASAPAATASGAAALAAAAPLALVLALAVLAAWRGVCVLAGPDVDTDAYAHHMIARAILADPHDLAVHWVWLPLFHYLQVPLVWAGGTMNTVRWTNLALAAVTPWMLFRYVRRTARTGPGEVPASATAFVAALVAAACPIVMQMGTTAQPEPLFALVMIGLAVAFQERRYKATAAFLGAAVLLRYEAWASFLVIAPWILAEQAGARFSRAGADGARETAEGASGFRRVNVSALAVIAVPVALIAIWAILRRPVDGRWFGFLGQTRQFANDATHEQSALDRGLLGLAMSALYYPVIVPVRVLGPVMALVPFGVARTVRDQGARFVAVFAACLAFISFSWITRSSLGLDRHFVAVVPLYATFAAQGAVALADGLTRLLGRVPAQWLAGGVTVVLLGGLALEVDVWMGFWRGSIERGWPDRTALGAYLRSVPAQSTIFCDDATLEILSGLDRRRFDRHWLDDPHTWDLVAHAAQAGEQPYVATWSRKLVGHDSLGEVVFRAGQEPDDAATGVAVMRVVDDGARAGR